MKKYSYLARLEELLEALPAEERQDALNYYEEFFGQHRIIPPPQKKTSSAQNKAKDVP